MLTLGSSSGVCLQPAAVSPNHKTHIDKNVNGAEVCFYRDRSQGLSVGDGGSLKSDVHVLLLVSIYIVNQGPDDRVAGHDRVSTTFNSEEWCYCDGYKYSVLQDRVTACNAAHKRQMFTFLAMSAETELLQPTMVEKLLRLR